MAASRLRRDKSVRLCSIRGVTWNSHENAWIASMKRRKIVLREGFEVVQYGDEVALALAIIRRRQMENFWHFSKQVYTSSFSSKSSCERIKPKRKCEEAVTPRDGGNAGQTGVAEEGLFFDSLTQAWVVHWFKSGKLKRKYFRASISDSFIKAFEFNDRITRDS